MSRRRRGASAAEPDSNRAVLYLRRSKDDGPGSLPVQQEAGQAYAGRAGLLVVETITDQESAYLDNSAQRAGYQRVLEMARAGAIHHIIVWQLTRFGRDAAEVMARTKELQRLGVRLHSTSEDLNNKLLLGFLAVLAEEESDRISERVYKRKRQLAAAGRFQSGTPPYGTILVDGKLLPGPRFPVVQAAYELAVAGLSYAAIAERLNADFAPSPPMYKRQVWRMLHNPAYVGILRGELPSGYGETVGSWEPMLPAELRRAALAAVRTRPDYGRRYQSMTWLRGLCWCGACGRACGVVRATTSKGTRENFYLRCNRACTGVNWRIDALEDWVAARARSLYLPPEDAPLIRSAVDAFNAEQERATGAVDLADQRAQLAARRERIETLIIDGVLDPGRGRERLREVEATLASIDARLALATAPERLDADAAVALFTTEALHDRRHVDPLAYGDGIRMWIATITLPPKPADPVIGWTEFARFLMNRRGVLM